MKDATRNEAAKPYHHGDLRRALIETALAMLGEEGGWQFTLRELARRAGVSHTASYKHFPDKAALLAELAMIGFDELRAALLAARPSSASPRDEFLEMSHGYVGFGASHPNLYRLMFSADARVSANPRLREHASAALEVLNELVARGQSAGWLKKSEPRAQVAAGWAQLHGLTLLTIDDLLGPDTVGPDAVEGALGTLLEGLEAG